MRSAEDERAKAEGELADENKACRQRLVDAGGCGEDDERGSGDGELFGEAFVGRTPDSGRAALGRS